jgi:hypothetical protein
LEPKRMNGCDGDDISWKWMRNFDPHEMKRNIGPLGYYYLYLNF